MSDNLHITRITIDEARKWLDAACDEEYPFSRLKQDTKYFNWLTYGVYQNNKLIASFVTRIEELELVVISAGGHLKAGSLYKLLTPYVCQIAKMNDCKYLRGHTSNKAVGKLMQKAGWHELETVYRKEI